MALKKGDVEDKAGQPAEDKREPAPPEPKGPAKPEAETK